MKHAKNVSNYYTGVDNRHCLNVIQEFLCDLIVIEYLDRNCFDPFHIPNLFELNGHPIFIVLVTLIS